MSVSQKISLYSIHFNKMRFLELQYNLFVKYCTDNFNFIVVNNGVDNKYIDNISNFCLKHNIQEIRSPDLFDFENRILYKAQDHARTLKFLYHNYIQNDTSKLRIVMDSDIFPFNEFSFFNLIDNQQLAGISLEQPYQYISSYITIFNDDVDLTNIPIYTEENKDSGLWTKDYVEKYKTKWLKHTIPIRKKEISYIFKNCEDMPLPYDYPFMFIESCFIHYWQGSGWLFEPKEYHDHKFEYIKNFIENINSYNLCLDNNVQYENAIMDEWIRSENYPLNKIS